MLGTGLFTGNLTPLWQGRFVFRHFDVDGRPVYAVSRPTGNESGSAAGHDGHPVDVTSGKYPEPAHTREYVAVDGPIYGLETVESGEAVLVTERIADGHSRVLSHPLVCGFRFIRSVQLNEKIDIYTETGDAGYCSNVTCPIRKHHTYSVSSSFRKTSSFIRSLASRVTPAVWGVK